MRNKKMIINNVDINFGGMNIGMSGPLRPVNESRAWTWGANFDGQLGTNDIIHRSSPVQTIAGGINWSQISASSAYNTGGLKTDGTLWLWGRNQSYQLGLNDNIYRSSPVQTVTGGTNWVQVSAGDTASAGIKNDGRLWVWGGADDGQLGNNDRITTQSSPVQTIASGTNWKRVSATTQMMAATKTDGTLWLWGSNLRGNLGDGTSTHRSSPVQTSAGGTDWQQVAVNGAVTAAIKTDGTLWMWGFGGIQGILGDNISISLYQVSNPQQTVAGGTNWANVCVGSSHVYAIKTDGTLWTWGAGGAGQLGDGSLNHRSSPVQTIAGWTNWRKISEGSTGAQCISIKADGTLWTWGSNQYGALGDGTIINKSSPVQTIMGGSNWYSVSGGSNHMVAIVNATILV